MPSQIIWYDSTETGAATLNNASGTLIEVLRTCLVNGFNSKSVSSITVSGGVATVTAAAHGFSGAYGKLVLIEGSGTAALNGRKQPSSITTNTFTFPAPGVADGTYTGSVTVKRAPLGWSEEYNDGVGTKAIFKRSAPEATVSMLRVVDTNASPAATTYAYVTMVSAATGVDAVSNEVPSTDVTQRWNKGSNTSAAKQWLVVGDDLYFYILLPTSTVDQYIMVGFGDPIALYPGDSTGALLSFSGVTSLTYGGIMYHQPGDFTPASGGIAQIHHGPLGGGFTGLASLPCGAGLWGTAGLSGVSDIVPVTGPYFIKTTTEVRAVYPGLHAPQGTRPFSHMQVVAPNGSDRNMLTLSGVRVGGSTLVGQVMVDIDGPWR